MLQINKSTSKFKLKICRSKIHKFGLFAQENIPARKRVIEYTGTRLNRKQAKPYKDVSFYKAPYLYEVNSYWTINGATGGGAQFTNHSCDPNLYAVVYGERIYFISNKDIRKGEELTVDYHLISESDIPCRCGSVQCRGKLNS